MKWFITFILNLSILLGVQAQLDPGYYEFETAPGLTYTGTWTTTTLMTLSYRNAGAQNDNVTFQVNGDYLIIYRILTSGFGQAEVCIDSVCSYMESKASVNVFGYPAWFILSGSDPHTVSITRTQTGSNAVALDSFAVIEAIEDVPESTPEPYYIYGSISGSEGDIETRFDMVATAGDVAVSGALLFLFFSLWAIGLMYFVLRGRNG